MLQVDDREVAWAAKLEELRVGAVSHGVEWLRSALSELFRDELLRVVWRHDPTTNGSL